MLDHLIAYFNTIASNPKKAAEAGGLWAGIITFLYNYWKHFVNETLYSLMDGTITTIWWTSVASITSLILSKIYIWFKIKIGK